MFKRTCLVLAGKVTMRILHVPAGTLCPLSPPSWKGALCFTCLPGEIHSPGLARGKPTNTGQCTLVTAQLDHYQQRTRGLPIAFLFVQPPPPRPFPAQGRLALAVAPSRSAPAPLGSHTIRIRPVEGAGKRAGMAHGGMVSRLRPCSAGTRCRRSLRGLKNHYVITVGGR